MINYIQQMPYWWLYLTFGFITGMAVVGMQKKSE